MIVLSALKILLLVILYITAFILLIFLFVFISKIRYDLYIDKNEGLNFYAKIRWLLGIIRINYSYTGEQGSLNVRVLCFRLNGKKPPKKNRSLKKDKAKIPAPENAEPNKPEPESAEPNKPEPESAELNEPAPVKAKTAKPKKTKSAARNGNDNKKKRFSDRIVSAVEKIMRFVEYPDKGKLIRYTLNLIIDVFRALKPKIFKLNAVIGFDDPSATGKCIGLIYAAAGALSLSLDVSGDFEKEILLINSRIKGHTSIWAICRPFIKFVIKKPVRKMLKKLLF